MKKFAPLKKLLDQYVFTTNVLDLDKEDFSRICLVCGQRYDNHYSASVVETCFPTIPGVHYEGKMNRRLSNSISRKIMGLKRLVPGYMKNAKNKEKYVFILRREKIAKIREILSHE